MFDSTPSNLPVTPPPAAPSGPPVSPPAGAPPAPMVSSNKKEPEDIFAGIEKGAAGAGMEAPVELTEAKPGPKILKLIMIAVIGLVVLGGLGFAGWYFLLRAPAPAEQALPTTTPNPMPTPVPEEVVEQPPMIEQPVVTEQPPVAEESATSVNVPPPVPITPPTPVEVTAPVQGKDTDTDGLTDVEEAIFSTNPTVADTDGDGYSDGSEVTNLYSPIAASKALDTDPAVQKQTWNNWSFLIPKIWSMSQDPVAPNILVITTAGAAGFKVQSQILPADTTFSDWAPANELYNAFTTRNGVQVLQSQTKPENFYVAKGDSVLTITYDLSSDTSYEYRTSLMMFVNSLQK